MALFKVSKGTSQNLPSTLTDGYCWYTYDDSKFYIDYINENGDLTRKALNAQDAETLTGASLATILNSSDVEIPTSKAVLDALSSATANLQTKINCGDTLPETGNDGDVFIKINNAYQEYTETITTSNGTKTLTYPIASIVSVSNSNPNHNLSYRVSDGKLNIIGDVYEEDTITITYEVGSSVVDESFPKNITSKVRFASYANENTVFKAVDSGNMITILAGSEHANGEYTLWIDGHNGIALSAYQIVNGDMIPVSYSGSLSQAWTSQDLTTPSDGKFRFVIYHV